MTVPDIKACVNLQGNTTSKGYSFSFQINKITDVKVNAIDSTGNVTPLHYGTDYTITTTQGVSGGDVTFTGWTNLGTDITFEIYRSEPIEQQYHFEEDERISPSTLESALDYRCRIEQELACEIDGLNLVLDKFKVFPDPNLVPDGKMLVTKNNHYIFQDQRVPDPTGLAQGAILGIDNNLWKPITNIAVGRELPVGGTTGQLLQKIDDTIDFKVGWVDKPTLQNLGIPTYVGNSEKVLQVKQDESGVEWVNAPDSLPDQSGHAGEHLVTDGTNPSWEAQRTPAPPNTDGKILISQGGQWVASDPKGATQDLYDSSGILEGYDLTKTGNNVVIPEIKVQFYENGKIVPVTLQTRTISFASETDGVYYLVATSDGNITKTQTLPKVGDPTNINLGLVYKENGSIRDIETRAINLINLPAQVKKLYERIGGRILDGAFKSDGNDELNFESIAPNLLKLWKYGINSQNPQDYEEGTYNYTNPLTFKIIDKDGNEGNIQQNVDFTPQYYDLTTGALSNLSAGKWTFQLAYITENTNYLHITNGLGEYDNHSYFHTADELIVKYNSLIPEYLRLFGICVGTVVIHEGEDFTQSSEVVPYGAGSGVASSSTPPSQQNDFVEDISNGLLGTCKIEKTGVGESFSVTFTGKAVFYDSGTDKLSLVDPQNVATEDIVGGNFTYIYLPQSGVVQIAAAKNDVPRGDILLGVIEHLDGARITNIDTVYTSSNVDAHRIKDVYKSYKPTVEGCTIYLQTITDNTDPNNPIIKTQLGMTSGRFFNYCADDNKQYDNHWIDIAEKPLGEQFWFRSTEPEDYGKNWEKSVSSTKNDEFLEAKIIPAATPIDLSDGETTLYPVMLSSSGNVILIVPRMALLATSMPSVDGDEVWRNFEKDIDRITLENYAVIGFVYADKESSVTTWGYGATLTAIRNKYDTSKGTSTKLPYNRYGTALVEHKAGVIQEYDPLSYTLAWDGDMDNYPDHIFDDITRGYWTTGDSVTTGDSFLGIHDVVDDPTNTGVGDSHPSTGQTLQSGMSFTPTMSNNHSLPFTFKGNVNNSLGSSVTVEGIIGVRPKLVVDVEVKFTVNYTSDLNNIIDFQIDLGALNTYNKTKNDIHFSGFPSQVTTTALTPNPPQSPGLPYFTAIIELNGASVNGGMIQFPKLQWDTAQHSPSNGSHYCGMFLYAVLRTPPIKQNDAFTFDCEVKMSDPNASKKKITEILFGKLNDLNVASSAGHVMKGNIANDLVAGTIVCRLNFKPKSGTTYIAGSKWNCYNKHNDLMKLVPILILRNPTANADGSFNELSSEIAEVINWHSARYTLRGVTSAMLNSWDVIIGIKDINNATFLNDMNVELGAVMADDAF